MGEEARRTLYVSWEDAVQAAYDRYLYLTAREGALAPAAARRAYDRYTPYQVPRSQQ